MFMIISFAFSFALSYELYPPRTFDKPFSFLMMTVPDTCWLLGRVEKCRVALDSLCRVCSTRHLFLLLISISALWDVLAGSGAGGNATLLSSLPAEHSVRYSLTLPKSGLFGLQKQLLNFISLLIPVWVKFNQILVLCMYMNPCRYLKNNGEPSDKSNRCDSLINGRKILVTEQQIDSSCSFKFLIPNVHFTLILHTESTSPGYTLPGVRCLCTR